MIRLCIVLYCVNLVSVIASDEGFCTKTSDNMVTCDDTGIKLTRLEGKQVGEVKTVTVDENRQLELKTINLKPLVFQIDDFLTPDECEHFISVAKDSDMVASHTEKQSRSGVQLMDLNHDKHLDMTEMKVTLENGYDVYLEDEDLVQMYTTLGIDINNDNIISKEEIEASKPADFDRYIIKLIREHPEKHSRYSKQAWLYPDKSTDDVFRNVQHRVSQVVELPIELIRLSDFQVVNYGVDGHYNAHLDSSRVDTGIPCCDRGKQKKCRICRYMTVLFYLNDVQEGGETAFPYANRGEINHTSSHVERVYHLYKKCDSAELRVTAKQGRAVIWYNHFLRDEDSWMGEVDEFTLHGGCPVKKGDKWIANFWIKTTDNKTKDIERMKKMY